MSKTATIIILFTFINIIHSLNPCSPATIGDKKTCKCFDPNNWLNKDGTMDEKDGFKCKYDGGECETFCPSVTPTSGSHDCVFVNPVYLIIDNNVVTKSIEVKTFQSLMNGKLYKIGDQVACCTKTKALNTVCGAYNGVMKLGLNKNEFKKCSDKTILMGIDEFFGILSHLEPGFSELYKNLFIDSLELSDFPMGELTMKEHLWYGKSKDNIIKHWGHRTFPCSDLRALASMYYSRVAEPTWHHGALTMIGVIRGANSTIQKTNKQIISASSLQVAVDVASSFIDSIASIITLLKNDIDFSTTIKVAFLRNFMHPTGENCADKFKGMIEFVTDQIPARKCWQNAKMFVDSIIEFYNIKIDKKKVHMDVNDQMKTNDELLNPPPPPSPSVKPVVNPLLGAKP